MVRLALAQLPRRPRLFHYRIHPASPRNIGPRTLFMVLTGHEREVKRRATLCYESQMALRRRMLFQFVDMPERFEEHGAHVHMDPARHPLRMREAHAREISFAILMHPRILLGRTHLLLLVPFTSGLSTLSVDLARRGTQHVRFANAGHGAVVRTDRHGPELVVTVSAPCLEPVEYCLAKLDLSRERQIGFFDPWTWLTFMRTHAVVPATTRDKPVVERVEPVPIPNVAHIVELGPASG
jgi:hypothetical protein